MDNILKLKYSRFNDLLRDLTDFASTMAHLGDRREFFVSRFHFDNLEDVPRSVRPPRFRKVS